MSMAGSDITIEILKDIRDEIRGVRTELRDEIRGVRIELGARLDVTNERLDTNNQRLDLVESTLLDLAEQQRFVVRYTKAISERDAHLEPRVSVLEARVDKLESK
jgi:hypothetical protein